MDGELSFLEYVPLLRCNAVCLFSIFLSGRLYHMICVTVLIIFRLEKFTMTITDTLTLQRVLWTNTRKKLELFLL